MAEKIYLVCGQYGQHDDFREWNIAAYTTKEQADLHAEKARETADGIYKNRKFEWIGDEDNPYDPKTDQDFDTKYVVEEITLHRHLNEFLEGS